MKWPLKCLKSGQNLSSDEPDLFLCTLPITSWFWVITSCIDILANPNKSGC